MPSWMVDAERFQESINGRAHCCFLWDEDGYFIPFRNEKNSLRIAVFTKSQSQIYDANDFYLAFPKSTELHTQGGIEEYAPQISESFVYFISDGVNIKIGISKHPKKRLASLQTAHSTKLEMLAVIPGDRETEFQLHGMFAEHHIRGEWFNDCAEIRRYIAANDNAELANAA